jgi:hypothetical protein
MKIYSLVMCVTVLAACTAGPGAQPGDSEVAISSDTSEITNACANQCTTNLAQCEANCNRFPNPFCESRCDQRFANCMRACGCPFVEEFDRISPAPSVPTNTFLCVGPRGGSGFRYRQINTFVRIDRIRQVLQCDGSITETVISSTIGSTGACYILVVPEEGCAPTQVSEVGPC